MKKQISILTLITSLLIFMTGCNHDLSRGEARKQISAWFKTNSNQMSKCTFNIRKSWLSDYVNNGGFCSVTFVNPPVGDELNMINYFVDKGLIQINKQVVYPDCAHWTVNTVTLTEAGRKFLVYEDGGNYTLLSATYDVDDVTGIRQEKGNVEAVAEYKLKRASRTPFGEFWSQNCLDVTNTYTAYFEKYDDGWRIRIQ